MGAREENERLKAELGVAKRELAMSREKVSEAERLAALLHMRAPAGWDLSGARIISHRLGPNASLETILIDKGSLEGLGVNTPVASPEGVVGRVLRISPNAANVLLITDPNSRIPVTSQKNRIQGILRGEGPNKELTLEYVPLGAPIEENEILVTSGLAEIFPKGIPAARVIRVAKGGSSLFQTVYAAPLFAPERLEEVALLRRASDSHLAMEEMADEEAGPREGPLPLGVGDSASPERSAAAISAAPPTAQGAVEKAKPRPNGGSGTALKPGHAASRKKRQEGT